MDLNLCSIRFALLHSIIFHSIMFHQSSQSLKLNARGLYSGPYVDTKGFKHKRLLRLTKISDIEVDHTMHRPTSLLTRWDNLGTMTSLRHDPLCLCPVPDQLEQGPNDKNVSSL